MVQCILKVLRLSRQSVTMNTPCTDIEGEVYRCTLCSKILGTEELLIRHVVTRHWVPEGRRCENCCGPQIIKIYRGYGCAASCSFPTGALQEVAVSEYPAQFQDLDTVSSTSLSCGRRSEVQSGVYAEIAPMTKGPTGGMDERESMVDGEVCQGMIVKPDSTGTPDLSQIGFDSLMMLSDFKPKDEQVDTHSDGGTPFPSPSTGHNLSDEKSLSYGWTPLSILEVSSNQNSAGSVTNFMPNNPAQKGAPSPPLPPLNGSPKPSNSPRVELSPTVPLGGLDLREAIPYTKQPPRAHLRYQPKPPKPEVRCDICGETFPTKTQFNVHQYYEHDIANIKCILCAKAYPHAHNVRRHIALNHRDKKEIGRCYVCNEHFGFHGEKQLSEHMNLRHAGKLNCMFCGRAMSSVQSLVSHVGLRHAQQVGGHLPQMRGANQKFVRKLSENC